MSHVSSTDFLQFIAKHNIFVLFEKAAPAGRLKREFISLVAEDGRVVTMRTPSGFSSGQIEVPREIFDDFLAASFIEQDRPEDSDGRIFFRLSRDGRERAASSEARIYPRKAS
jgi:hypothetical protein